VVDEAIELVARNQQRIGRALHGGRLPWPHPGG